MSADAPPTPISGVSDTAFWVAAHRAKETDRADALFRDPFAKALVGGRAQAFAGIANAMSRYVEWTVVSRTVIIDRFIEQALKDGVDAVVNLGAGLDSRPYRMSLPESLEWVEADQPGIIAHKSRVLAAERPRCKLTRVEVDLADGAERRAFLDSAAPAATKILVLTEGVIPYLRPEHVAELGSDLRARPRFAYWITEYFHPRVYRHLQRPARARLMRNAPFLFYPENWYGFFRKAGWIEKETRYSGEIALQYGRKPPMPFLFAMLLPLLPRRIKELSVRMAGYVLFERA